MELTAILAGIQAAIAAAPKVIEVVNGAKQIITGLFKGGVIDKATQDALHAKVDDIAEAFVDGKVPPGWDVEPDPA